MGIRQALMLAMVCAVVMGGVTAAHAASISYDSVYNLQPNDETSLPVSLQQFNPALGTLLGFTIFVYDSGDVKYWVASDDDGVYNIYYSSGSTGYLSSTYHQTDTFDLRDYNDWYGEGEFKYDLLYQGDSGYQTDPSVLAAYTGTGSVSGYYNTVAIYESVTLDDGLYGSPLSSLYRQTWTVDYNYDPPGPEPPADVPEPSSLVLLLCGLSAGMFYQRRRRS
jgi:hypothetical protein